MENITFKKPVIDLTATGAQIKNLRKLNGLSVKDIQDVFGFEYPQAVYAWEQGKNVPTIDNLLVLSKLFGSSLEEIVVTRLVDVDVTCSADLAVKLCGKKCQECKYRLSA